MVDARAAAGLRRWLSSFLGAWQWVAFPGWKEQLQVVLAQDDKVSGEGLEGSLGREDGDYFPQALEGTAAEVQGAPLCPSWLCG